MSPESRLDSTIVTEKLYYRKDLFLKLKGTPSHEEQKTGFSVFTTIEINLLIEFTNSGNDRLRTFNLL